MIKIDGNEVGRNVSVKVSDEAIKQICDVEITKNKVVNDITTEIGNVILSDFDTAVKGITAISELQQEQKEFLIKLLSEAKDSALENNDGKKETCKVKFAAFLTGVGKVAENVISVLANLAKVAEFFGLKP